MIEMLEERALHWEREAERHDERALPQKASSLEDQVDARREAARCRSRAAEFRALITKALRMMVVHGEIDRGTETSIKVLANADAIGDIVARVRVKVVDERVVVTIERNDDTVEVLVRLP